MAFFPNRAPEFVDGLERQDEVELLVRGSAQDCDDRRAAFRRREEKADVDVGVDQHTHRSLDHIIDNIARRGECDFVTDVAAELPLQVILEMVGVQLTDRQLVECR